MSFKVIIPARFASTRLPGKPLMELAGKPMIQLVHERACESGADEVVIATDDQRIADAALDFGAEVCLTDPGHASGTERIAEVAASAGWGDDVILVNLQGDEPCMPSTLLAQVANDMESHERAEVTTLASPIDTVEQLFDPHVVKVITDAEGYSASMDFEYVVVYDPESGFVTGGGWIDSPPGAYASDPSLTGKANFGFVSKYDKKTSEPIGQTEFQFKVADLNFHSDSYDWLVVAGPRAKFKGTGTINGLGNYGFMITATDAALTPSTDADLFRIKIWDKDNGDATVYDNQMGESDDAYAGTELGGGNIKIHKVK